MKTLNISIFICLLSSFSFAQNFRDIAFQANGLTCSMCSNAIQKSLRPIPFIQDIRTDLTKNIFYLSLKENTEPDFDLIRKKVEDAGFSIGKLTVSLYFNNQQISSDKHILLGGKAFHFLDVKSQTLNGWHKVELVDKGFLHNAEAKKWQATTTMPCYKTGAAATCCTNAGIAPGQRIYHITI